MTDKNQNEPGTGEEKQFNRERLLILSSSVLKRLEDRMTGGQRFRETDSDQTYLGYVRALSGLITAHNGVMKDRELSELEQRLTALENGETNTQRVREYE